MFSCGTSLKTLRGVVKAVTVFPEKEDENQHHALKLIFIEACIVCLLIVLSGKNSSYKTNKFVFSNTEEKIK